MMLPRPRRSQLGVGALVIAALAMGQLLHRYVPESEPDRPFKTAAASDGVHHLRFGDLRVTKVEGSRRVNGQTSVDPTLRTPGVFVVVTFRWTPRVGRSAGVPNIASGELHDNRGRVTTFSIYGDRSVRRCGGGSLGLPSTCFAVVEADPATLPGARLVLGSSPLDERYDSVAEIDLAITAADVRVWRSAEPIEPPLVGVKKS